MGNFPEPPLGLAVPTSASLSPRLCRAVALPRPNLRLQGGRRAVDSGRPATHCLTPRLLRNLWWRTEPRLLGPACSEEGGGSGGGRGDASSPVPQSQARRSSLLAFCRDVEGSHPLIWPVRSVCLGMFFILLSSVQCIYPAESLQLAEIRFPA